MKVLICIGLLALAAGCAAPGVPEPPSLELARPVRDLRAMRKANQVHLTWSIPTETTDHHAFHHVGKTKICRAFEAEMRDCETPVIELSPQSLAQTHATSPNANGKTAPQASYTDQLSPSVQMQSPRSNLIYAVSVLNSYGKSAGLSNQVQVPSAPTLAAPANLKAQLSQQGIELTWAPVASPSDIAGLRYEYRVYRRDVQTGKDAIAGEVPVSNESNPKLLDSTFEWEKTYDYRLTVVTYIEQVSGVEQVEGDDTPALRVVAHDIFPPGTPAGLQAVFSGPGQKPFIDLIWGANTEIDFAGYNIYRHETNQPATKINPELIKTPAFRDFDVLPGHTYFYSVSAVDVRGNESSRSREASETVPAQ